MFGRKVKLPIDFSYKNHYSPEKLLQEYEDAFMKSITEVQTRKFELKATVKSQLSTYAKQKSYYDRKHKYAACFTIGSNVIMKDFRRKEGMESLIIIGKDNL
uniref:Uncharacterized protein n=1 Tax=Amphimedon queenslandica TaxID=400682 RepID=A0A1X7VXK0_AMPQE